MAFGELAVEEERKYWVRGQDKHDREQVAADNNGDGFEHGLCLSVAGQSVGIALFPEQVWANLHGCEEDRKIN